MTDPLNILIIEDNEADFLLIKRRLQKDGLSTHNQQVKSKQELAKALRKGNWDIALADYNVPGLVFHETLSHIHEHTPDLPVIVVSGSIGEETAIDLLKQGVCDFVIKDRLARLVPAIERALNDVKTQQRIHETESTYRNLFESISDAIYIQDEQGHFLDVNQGAIAMHGYPREFFIGKTAQDLAAPEHNNGEIVAYAIQSALNGKPQQLKLWSKRHNGKAFPQEVRFMSTTYRGQQAAIAIGQDITERLASDARMHEDHERQTILRTMLEITLGSGSLEETLEQCLKSLLKVSWLNALPRGALFLMTKDKKRLQLTVSHDMGPEIKSLCECVPVGHCHCGKAADAKQIQYGSCRDEPHEANYPDILRHGHYSLPLLLNAEVLGVLLVLLPPGFQRDSSKEQFLASVADILAGYINRKYDEEHLRLAAAVLESTHEGVMVTDHSNRILTVNPAFTRITGYSKDEILGKTTAELQSKHHDSTFYKQLWNSIKQSGFWQGEIWNRRKSGEVYPEWLTISTVYNEHDAITNYVGVFTDISELKHAEERIAHLAHHDALTDLPNRTLIQSLLNHAIEQAKREGHLLAILFMDLDRFKHVNDSLGHAKGDELLQIAATRLNERIRDSDVVARLGGDEFLIVLDDIHNPDDIATIASDLVELFSSPIQLSCGQEVFIGASIGISVFPDDGDTADQLIRNADAAMYQAKDSGRNTYRFYTEALTLRAEQRMHLEGRLRHALENNELTLHYQLQVKKESNKSLEALVRWHPPEDGLIEPMRFIPLAEETGLIIPLGEWVLRTACLEMKRWQDSGLPLSVMAVNLSPIQFKQQDIVQCVEAILKETSLPPACLELEITESTIMEEGKEAEAKLAALHRLGVRLSIDDFGTGYSSLAYLQRFPIHQLKIDQHFVQGIPESPAAMELASVIISMAKNLGLEVLAEGVETPAQFSFLKSQGCDAFQGYLFSRPLPALKIPELLKQDLKLIDQ